MSLHFGVHHVATTETHDVHPECGQRRDENYTEFEIPVVRRHGKSCREREGER